MDRFQDSELFTSLRSPFARRVRLAFFEHQIPFQEVLCDVFRPSAELIEVNPLARVPALRLASGEILVDSHLILQEFYENRTSLWMPQDVSARAQVCYWQALAVGFSEKIVEYFLDSQRSEPLRDPEVQAELHSAISRLLPRLEHRLRENLDPGILVGNHLTQADLDWGAALSYLGLRVPEVFITSYPRIHAYLQNLESRPSFQKTKPPG
ncbi:MAG: glutathione S-transferase family protein [Bdellovibrionia bacterium]